MDRKSTIEALLQRLELQPRSAAVEAAYLVVRCLTHRWTKADFSRLVEAEAKLPYQQRAVELMLDMMSMIEQSEGVDVSRLPDPVRNQYERQLIQATLSGGDRDQVDRGEVDAALRELRGAA